MRNTARGMRNTSRDITVNELIRRRKEVIDEIAEDEAALARKRTVLFHLSQTLRSIDPTIQLDKAAAPPSAYRKRRGAEAKFLSHGEITEIIYDLFRESADQTLTSGEVTFNLLQSKGLDPELNPIIKRDFELRVRNQLFALRRTNRVEKVGVGRGANQRWRQLRGGRSE
jgi:hypothetical protein